MSASTLVADIRRWGLALGFQQVGISDIDLTAYEARLDQWLAQNHHGEMGWMASHGRKRSRPELLQAGTRSVIVARMDYLPPQATRLSDLSGYGVRRKRDM